MPQTQFVLRGQHCKAHIVDYGPAAENLGWSTNHLVLDTPYTYPGTNIQPNDWDHKFMGSMTMRYALAQSRNLPAIRTLQEVGYTKSSEFLKKLGIDYPADEMGWFKCHWNRRFN